MVIGITGIIGSGKTLFSTFFEQKGFHVLNSDTIAKNLSQNDFVKESILQHFSTDILNDQGQINREKLGSIVFQDFKKLDILNEIFHPLVSDEIKKTLILNKDKHSIVESALLFQASLSRFCDLSITIYRPKKLILKHLTRQNYLEETTLLKLMDHQNKSNHFQKNTDIIVYNTSNIEELEHKFNKLYSIMKDVTYESKFHR